jgi:hypothetical protein
VKTPEIFPSMKYYFYCFLGYFIIGQGEWRWLLCARDWETLSLIPGRPCNSDNVSWNVCEEKSLIAEAVEVIHRLPLLCKIILKGVGIWDLRSSAMTPEINAVMSQMMIDPLVPCSKSMV